MKIRTLQPNAVTAQLSGTQAREWYRDGGVDLPTGLGPEAAAAIAETYQLDTNKVSRFTGLSAAGKSTTAEILPSCCRNLVAR